MREGEVGRNLPDQPYPKGPAQRVCHRPRHRQRSSQRQWGHRPDRNESARLVLQSIKASRVGKLRDKERGRSSDDLGARHAGWLRARIRIAIHTSGKVPLEKTLQIESAMMSKV
jgi:hypothetical protein